MVDAINNNPNSSFKAALYPKFARMTIGDAKRFLSPVRPPRHNQGSAVPVGANEYFFNYVDNNYITGLSNVAAFPNLTNASNQIAHDQKENHSIYPTTNIIKFPVFDVTQLCSSWAPAVTSAMSISVSRWAGQFVNFSLQFVLDCDILGDSCVERTPLSAYQLFWTYHPPDFKSWDRPGDENSERANFMQAPRADFKRENCENNRCYTGLTNCGRHWALTGNCNPGDLEVVCPIYFLYNWRWIKSHLWEVGAVTSSITVYSSLFSYNGGVYSGYWMDKSTITTPSTNNAVDNTNNGATKSDLQESWGTILGMLDVTIIGWGQKQLNISNDSSMYKEKLNRWWWVIPQFGINWGIKYDNCNADGKNCVDDFKEVNDKNNEIKLNSLIVTGAGINKTDSKNILMTEVQQTEIGNGGFMKFNRRFDDCNIESNAVGAVPYNFVPLPHRTPEPTAVQENQ
ncbi:hypothetical protein TVAG_262170 [Trichomonas vaginalis G3]|uniref:Uncharacterized protein n=1 Tax=Trichomonas vaginalis (strain ATCC PRA-98 / G3) TaxID=412133 RepID=A2DUC9_TRIV3|nr:cysteine proteinases family [Trichomonas vaginalis G3]EAY15967.1 hypothetical protein TVAG_262170 [Trichomonas vaginalis G3]KAI5523602.1 cysteine proteinases family [Trichomonas vaginalis G3]|eukprot:XP_001328190.1 hypothetical protein [Trichomonas vaginalis G3]